MLDIGACLTFLCLEKKSGVGVRWGMTGNSVRLSFCCLAADKKTNSVFLKVGVINGTPASSFDCLTSRMIEHKLKESEEVKKLITGIVGD